MSDEIVLRECGCFTHPDIPGELWPCSLHRGQTEAQRQADAEQQVDEAIAFNNWNPDASRR